MRENRREGVGREVRKWGRFVLLVLLSPPHTACFSLSSPSRSASRLSSRSRLVRRLVACLLSCGARAFSFRRSPRRPSVVLVVPMFVSFARRSIVPASRFCVSSCLSGERGD